MTLKLRPMIILTPRRPLTLREMCLARTGALLINGHYQQDSGADNPFSLCPPEIVDDLFRTVDLANESMRMSRLHTLRPLLTSGRIRNLNLYRSHLNDEDFFKGISSVLRDSNLRRLWATPDVSYKDMSSIWLEDILFTRAVKNFLSKCTNIEYLSIPGDAFDVNVLKRHLKLKILNIFFLEHSLKLLASKIDESFIHHNLVEVRISGRSEDLPETMAKILECCPNLVSARNDIAGALLMMHEKQFYIGDLNKKYKLQRYELELLEPNTAMAIASVTCPLTKMLVLYLKSEKVTNMECMTSFANLESLSVENSVQIGYPFGLSIIHSRFGDALTVIGALIKHLNLSFFRVDFGMIGSCCPNLINLCINHLTSCDIPNRSAQYFTKLEELSFSYHDDDYVPAGGNSVLQFLLSSCRGLRTLSLKYVDCLTDRLLEKILEKNSLPCLKEIELFVCSLTQKGIQVLLENCRCLESIYIFSTLVPCEKDVMKIVKNFHPNAYRYCEYPIVELLNSYTEKRKCTPMVLSKCL